MKKTGAILKEAREKKGLSLHEIGLSLKINSKILKAIEEGDESQLPAKTFLRGFVQSYAAYLHLNVQDVLQSFYEEMGSTIPKPHQNGPAAKEPPPPTKPDLQNQESVEEDAPVEEEKPVPVQPVKKAEPTQEKELDSSKFLNDQRKSNSKMKAIGITFLVILTAGVIFTKKMVDKYSKEAEVPDEIAQTIEGATPLEDNTTEPPLQDSETTEESTADSEKSDATGESSQSEAHQSTPPVTAGTTAPASPTASEQTNASTPATPVEKPAAPTTPNPTPAATSSATPSTAPSSVPSTTTPPAAQPAAPPVTPSPSPAPTAKPETPQKPKETPEIAAKNLELIIEALDHVEIEYASPQGAPTKIKLGPEQVHTFKSKSGLKLKVSNGGAINIIVNGRDLGVPGDLGKPLTLSY